MTLAALEGRTTVIEPDVHEAASYALPHRLRSQPFEDEPDLEEILEDRFDTESSDEADGADDAGGETAGDDGEAGVDGGDADPDVGDDPAGGDNGGSGSDTDESDSESNHRPDDSTGPSGGQPAPAEPEAGESDASGDRTGDEEPDETGDDSGDDSGDEDEAQPLVPGQRRGDVAEVGEASAPDLETSAVARSDGAARSGSRASAAPSVDNRGARVRTEPADDGPIDAAASVRSAAARGSTRVERSDLRQSVRAGETSVTIVFAVDASASMRPAMRTAKGVVLELLRDSYEQRDQVAFVAFAGEDADVLLPPTDSVSLAARHLKELPSGDRTPLPAGLETAGRVLERAETDASVVVLVTDGRANVADGSPTEATRRAARELAGTDATVIVVDAGDDSRAGLSTLVADETGGELVDLASLSAERVRAAADRATTE